MTADLHRGMQVRHLLGSLLIGCFLGATQVVPSQLDIE